MFKVRVSLRHDAMGGSIITLHLRFAVYELVHGTDEQVKRKLESRLRDLEGHGRAQPQQQQQKQQQQQQQNSDARAALRLKKIKEIVKKEGNFYEIVKYKPLGKTLKFNDEPYLHVRLP